MTDRALRSRTGIRRLKGSSSPKDLSQDLQETKEESPITERSSTAQRREKFSDKLDHVSDTAISSTELLARSHEHVDNSSAAKEASDDDESDLDDCYDGEFDGKEVVTGLFVGSEICAKDHAGRRRRGITHVITILSRFETSFETVGDMVQKGRWREFDCENRPVADLLSHLDNAVDFINEAFRQQGKVCIVSLEGNSRSVSIVVAYLVKTLKMTLKSATDLIYSICPGAAINRGFWRQLACFELLNRGSCSIPEEQLPGAIIFEKDELQEIMTRYRKRHQSAGGYGALSPTSATGIASLNLRIGSPDHKRKGEGYSWPSQKSPRGESTL